jgi:hypothetical protein
MGDREQAYKEKCKKMNIEPPGLDVGGTREDPPENGGGT